MLSMSQMELDVCFGVILRKSSRQKPGKRKKAGGKRRFALLTYTQSQSK